MLNKNEVNACLQLLDRVAVTGHQERGVMNNLVNKLAIMLEQFDAPPQATAEEPASPSLKK